MGAETSPEQQYSLRWNDFHSSILSSFRHLRDEEDFVDVTLACDGCSFTAHKVVLSACSPYFRKLLKANPCQHPIVILRDVQHKDMESLLRFMYNGEVHIGQEQLTDFLKTAQMLQVRGLADVPAGAASVGQRLTSTTTEDKISPNTSSSLPWSTEKREYEDRGSSPPPAKRARSSDRGEATPDRHRSPSRGNGDMQESLLGQALEGPTPKEQKMNSESSMQAHSTGEESNSSDTAMSDHQDPITPKTEISDYPMLDDHHPYNSNGGLMDQSRQSSFPGALLGLQGLGGLLPGPSGMHGTPDSFDASSRTGIAPPYPQQEYVEPTANVKYECPLCDMILSNPNEARQHIDQHYPRDSPYCPVTECGKRFSHPNSVRNHMRSKHAKQWEIMKHIKTL
ncbi:protein abrupt-like isoform X4 [Coccinella septempunctata]|uniref:protein abrupt-like isoform X4 n=1 Tax=Coccinella septempunctata TaxID=41139 RepID=UPI001D07752F|nr:protein abrupt-like isoform X4 [Coccinella septempunctata]